MGFIRFSKYKIITFLKGINQMTFTIKIYSVFLETETPFLDIIYMNFLLLRFKQSDIIKTGHSRLKTEPDNSFCLATFKS